MKLAVTKKANKTIYGIIKNSCFFCVRADFKQSYPTLTDFIILIDQKLQQHSNQVSALEANFESVGHPLTSIKLLPPVTQKSKIICVGINYPKLYKDKPTAKPNHIILFSKFYETLVGDKDTLSLPLGKAKNSFDYEAEIAVVIGKPAFAIPKLDAEKHILGYTLFNDGSVREWQNHSIEAGKNFYRSGACGPYIVTGDEIHSKNELNFKTKLNGELVQNGNLTEMFFDINEIIAYVSHIIPLLPGDIIATGSPEGTGASQSPKRFLRYDDVIEISSPALGTLTNTVK